MKMKRRLFYFLLIIQTIRMGHSSAYLEIRNNQHSWGYPSRSADTGSPVINSDLMNKLRKVLVETLKSLSHVNSKLAQYFVQHHPSLENVYRKISEKRESISKPQRIVQNKRAPVIKKLPLQHAKSKILVHTSKDVNKTVNQQTTPKSKGSNSTTKQYDSTTPVFHTKSKPILIGLSEFERKPPRTDNINSMNARNISTSSLNANKVSSKVVRANHIVANNVVISSASNTPNFQYQRQNNVRAMPASFSIRNNGFVNGGGGFGLVTKARPTQHRNNRRNYFPPRQDGRNGNNVKSQRITVYPRLRQTNDKTFSIHNRPHNSFSRPITIRQGTAESQKRTIPAPRHNIPKTLFIKQNRKPPERTQSRQRHHNSRNFWHDSWSESDSGDDFYDVTSEETNQQSGISGMNINARSIKAKRVYASKVKASTIKVQRVIADDVIVSARFGK